MGLAARIGLHTGECVLAPQGLNGAAIDVATQIRELAQPSEVLVSGTLRDLVAGSGIRFQACGRLEAEGAREWQILRIEQV
jgi:class 3 adenylate cyclase